MTTDNFRELSYWKVSKNIYYSIFFITPMLFLYEFLCWFQFYGAQFQIRNGADVLIRQLFSNIGYYSELAYSLIILLIFIIIIWLNRNVIKKSKLKISFLLFMFIESLFWCVIFILFMGLSEKILLIIMEQNITLKQLYLSIGAGIWEELLFRVGAIGSIVYFLKNILCYNRLFAALLGIIISALLFSFFHYVGQLGDIFTYKSFLLRTFAGIILGAIYIIRGFGITAYTHIFYNMAIISIPILMDNN